MYSTYFENSVTVNIIISLCRDNIGILSYFVPYPVNNRRPTITLPLVRLRERSKIGTVRICCARETSSAHALSFQDSLRLEVSPCVNFKSTNPP